MKESSKEILTKAKRLLDARAGLNSAEDRRWIDYGPDCIDQSQYRAAQLEYDQAEYYFEKALEELSTK